MSNQKNMIPVNVSIPPPPEYPIEAPNLTDSITNMKQNILLHTQQPPSCISVEGVNTKVFGDVKLTLDDLKANVLGYFSALYKPHGITIEEKIADLRKSYNMFEPQFDSKNRFSCHSTFKPEFFEEPTNLRINPLTMLPFEYSDYQRLCGLRPSGLSYQDHQEPNKLQHHTPFTVPLSILDENGTVRKPLSPTLSKPLTSLNANITNSEPLNHHYAQSFHAPLNFDSLLSPSATPRLTVSHDNLSGSTFLTSTRLKDSTPYSSSHHVSSPINDNYVKEGLTQNLAQQYFDKMKQLKTCAPLGVTDLVHDVKLQVDKATHRLDNLSSTLARETENPSLKSYSYTRCPNYKRKPRFGSQKEMEECMLQLYADLYSQVEWNERRIKALRQKMQLFQITAASFASTRIDPRDAS